MNGRVLGIKLEYLSLKAYNFKYCIIWIVSPGLSERGIDDRIALLEIHCKESLLSRGAYFPDHTVFMISDSEFSNGGESM